MSSLGPPSYKRQTEKLEQVSRRPATKMVRYLGHNTGEEDEGTVLNMEKAGSGIVWYVDVFAVFNHLVTGCMEERPKLFLALHMGRKRGTAPELKQGKS